MESDEDIRQRDRIYSILLVLLGGGAAVYGAIALSLQPRDSILPIFDMVFGSLLILVAFVWGPLLERQPREAGDARPVASPHPPLVHSQFGQGKSEGSVLARSTARPPWQEDPDPWEAVAREPYSEELAAPPGIADQLESIRRDASPRRRPPSAAAAGRAG